MQIRREIARGGFGVVQEVLHRRRLAARKVFDPSPLIRQDPDLVGKAKRRFVRETKVQAQLSHPHIAPIYDADLDDDPPWFTMPLAKYDYWEQIAHDRLAQILDVDAFLQILSGVEELHRLGFVHRDLKPGNVLHIDERWQISDFGLVLPPSSANTSVLSGTHSSWCTEAYAAPELITDFRNAPPQADVFALGCMLHDAMGHRARVPFSRIEETGPLGAVMERCTEPNPSNRFPTIAALRSAIVTATRSAAAPTAPSKVRDLVNTLEFDPEGISRETWLQLVRLLDIEMGESEAEALCLAIDLEQLDALFATDPIVFSRAVAAIVKWIANGQFDFAFCDVLGARLDRIYQLGGVRDKADATMAVFVMGCTHNRWSVMDRFMRMASPHIGQDLADRLAIEMCALGWSALMKIEQIETVIHVSRSSLHPTIVAAIETLEGQFRSLSGAKR